MPAPLSGGEPEGMRFHRAPWAVVTFLSLAVALVASRYLRFDPATYFDLQRDVFIDRELVLGLHVGGAMVALVVGPWQFLTGLRRRLPRLHRTLGAGYALGCLIGGLGGLALSTTAHGGLVSSLGFACLAVAWLATTAYAVRMALTGRFAEHRRWMIRSFSLTFAAVTLRLYLGVYAGLDAAQLLDTANVTFTEAYRFVAWLCWVPNLAVAWWMTRDRTGAATPERSLVV